MITRQLIFLIDTAQEAATKQRARVVPLHVNGVDVGGGVFVRVPIEHYQKKEEN